MKMAETVRSLFDYREPPTLDSDGEGSKPQPPRGRGCGRKRKGTPVKVCDRVFATEDDEESTSEHSYCPGEGQYQGGEGGRHKLPAPEGPYYIADSTQLCVSEQGEEGDSGARGPILYPPTPNCRIREVHCGNQVRLVVIAIRDITKGEEITVDYSLTEWGENAMGFHGTVPPAGFECNSDPENGIKKEDEAGQVPVSVSEYITPSWSLSPSSSPLSHSDGSDSDCEEEEDEEEEDVDGSGQRGRAQHRQKKRRHPSLALASGSICPGSAKKKPPQQRPPGHPPGCSSSASSIPRSLPSSPPQHPHPTRPLFKCPAPAVGASSSHGGVHLRIPMPYKQCCVYCGRHFRSLQRHLDKHHAHQPDVRAALERAHTQPHPSAHPPHLHASLPSSSSSSSLHLRDGSAPGGGAAALVLPSAPPRHAPSPNSRRSPALSPGPRKSPAPIATTPPRRGGVPVSVLKRSPPTQVVNPPRKVGRKVKKEREEEVEEAERRPKEEEVPTPIYMEHKEVLELQQQVSHPHLPPAITPDEEDDDNCMGDYDSGADDKKDIISSRRPHIMPLLSSLSSLVLYLRRLQHSAFISLSRSPQSAEAWRLLCHSSLALLILYNRRRECEVSKLTITEYHARITPQCPIPVPPGAPPALTPLEASLSPFERLVLPHLPRVGVQGKRGRVQPLILPPHSEACLDMLLQTRPGVGVDPLNPYVFARPYHSPATPLRGTDLLRSLARSSGTRNPRALTQTRVRRQVAILTQLLLLSEGEEEAQRGTSVQRLENFLQREYHVTQSCAGIGQDPGLMGLIGRVVLCGERDGVLFRGMSLHHICLELDVMSGNSGDSFSEESDGEQGKEKMVSVTPAAMIMMKKGSANGKSPRPKKMNGASPFSPGRKRGSGQPKPGKRGVLKRPWSEAERTAVESHLTRNIAELRVPAKADCERCLQLCPLLVSNRRDWRAIKFYCHNRIQLLKKTRQREGNSSDPLPIC
ncbi:uncharacterized protein si:dkey-117m1.4 isoform X1 [Clupea harengus]|uniref:Uncharacterized protein si:dkey-117m1.4 isoform X1 n=1 Tax=Clupea harengus TaxID=7950 RepID=A0A6P3VL33_CLUHA|nr:uncharacterized protein si:dkey-117m1.4 isoform X1 [Clupea harengus]